MVEGDKSYVYKINDENIANKTEVKTGLKKIKYRNNFGLN